MDSNEVKKSILEILDNFGMSGKKAAEAMGITYAVFRNKKNDNNKDHSFNAKNLENLIKFIKRMVNKLPAEYHQSSSNA